MNYRLNKTAITIVIILLIGAIGVFAYTLISSRGQEGPAAVSTEEENAQNDTTAPAITITAKHQFKDTKHTVAGSIDLPSPCHRLLAEPFFVGGNTGTAEIRFTTSIEGEQCEQVVTPARFKVTFEAPETAAISATIDGKDAILNLVPVPKGENLDDFDIYVKG